MGRYLIVANQTLGGGALLAKVRALHAAEPSTFHVLVPATPPADHPWTEGEVRFAAQERLDRCLATFRGMGIEATGEVGDPHPVDAIKDVLLGDAEPFDEIVLSTLRPGRSRWLRWDLISRVRGFGIAMEHVIGEAEPAER
ncbi:MAG TPA: hypothetical protein VF108_11545 [Actinomycetota bacterium]